MKPPSQIVPATPWEAELADGTRERVALRRLDIAQLYTFVELWSAARTPEMVALCLGKDLPWVARMSDDSYAATVRACIDANFHRVMTVAASDWVMAATAIPLARKALLVGQMADGLVSRLSSLESALPPAGPGDSAPATPSSSSNSSNVHSSASATGSALSG